MAFERVGLGGLLTFNSKQAEGSMKRLSKNFKSLRASTFSTTAAFDGFARRATLATAAVGALAIGLGARQFIKFEQQMSAVSAVTQATKPDFEALQAEAKRLGATTAFSATQAAQGMENLGRAGFTTEQIIEATGSSLALAAADGIDLATAADISAVALKSMGLQASQAGRVADVLAATSAKANTNVTLLGESFKIGAPAATLLGLELEETAAIFGKLSDAGLKGTLAGTAFSNFVTKIAKPTSKGRKFIDKFGLSLTEVGEDGTKQIKKISTIVEEFGSVLNRIEDPAERTAISMELFGIRGVRAFSALQKQGKPALDALEQSLQNAQGTAQRMAETRLDNVAGQLTLLKSAAEGLAIEFFGAFAGDTSAGIKSFTTLIQNTVAAMQALSSETGVTTANLKLRFGESAASVAMSLMTTIDAVKGFFKGIKQGISTVTPAMLPLIAVWNSLKQAVGLANTEAGGAVGLATEFGRILPSLVAALVAYRVAIVAARTATVAWKVIQIAFNAVMFLTSVRLNAGGASAAFFAVKSRIASIATLGFTGALKKGVFMAGRMLAIIAGPVGLIAAAAAFGFGLGKLIDKVFGLSDRLADLLEKMVDTTTVAKAFGFISQDAVIPNVKEQSTRRGAPAIRQPTKPVVNAEFSTDDPTLLSSQEPLKQFMSVQSEIDSTGMVANESQKEMSETLKEVAKNTADPCQMVADLKVNLDGKQVAKSLSRHKADTADRLGFQNAPFARRVAAEQGAEVFNG